MIKTNSRTHKILKTVLIVIISLGIALNLYNMYKDTQKLKTMQTEFGGYGGGSFGGAGAGGNF